jgi:hypothetical protein
MRQDQQDQTAPIDAALSPPASGAYSRDGVLGTPPVRTPSNHAKPNLSARALSYLDALTALQAALQGAAVGEASSIAETQGAFERHVERELVEPLQQLASRSTDPIVAVALAQIASLCGTLHRLSPYVKAWLAQTLASKNGQQFQWPSGLPIIEHYLQLIDRLLGPVKEVTRWRMAMH